MIRQLFAQILAAAFDLLAPPFCAHCKLFLSKREIFCEPCQSLIKPIVSTDLPINKNYTMRIFAISEYKEPLKSLIIAKSWGDIIASKQLAQLIWQHTYFRYQPCDLLIPIPLHWTRQAKRGYNQAQVIAQHLSREKNCALAEIAKRIKRTPFQSTLPVIERFENVSNAFKIKDPAMIENKHIFLVDDLMTTGSTLKVIAKELAKHNPASISAVVAARII